MENHVREFLSPIYFKLFLSVTKAILQTSDNYTSYLKIRKCQIFSVQNKEKVCVKLNLFFDLF